MQVGDTLQIIMDIRVLKESFCNKKHLSTSVDQVEKVEFKWQKKIYLEKK